MRTERDSCSYTIWEQRLAQLHCMRTEKDSCSCNVWEQRETRAVTLYENRERLVQLHCMRTERDSCSYTVWEQRETRAVTLYENRERLVQLHCMRTERDSCSYTVWEQRETCAVTLHILQKHLGYFNHALFGLSQLHDCDKEMLQTFPWSRSLSLVTLAGIFFQKTYLATFLAFLSQACNQGTLDLPKQMCQIKETTNLTRDADL